MNWFYSPDPLGSYSPRPSGSRELGSTSSRFFKINILQLHLGPKIY